VTALWERRIADLLRVARVTLESLEARGAAPAAGAPDRPEPAPMPAFDPQLTSEVLIPAFRPLYSTWFRVEAIGASNLPARGPGIVAANHGGGLWALDSVMTAVAVHDENPAHRHLRMLGADLIFRTPGVREVAALGGVTPAHDADVARLLESGELVGVWPEGYRGIGKPYAQRYQLQRFGRGGFVRAALRHGAPIIPTAIVGAEEIHPVLGNAPQLAKTLRLPYFPLTPTFPWLGPLGLIPLPSKWLIEFCPPIPTAAHGPDAADDPATVRGLVEQVRAAIADSLSALLARRVSPWS
jgi:1-acyl-sn-glycerol-3-phosphate acyltransferase